MSLDDILETIGDDTLAQYGTKGMKWGVRKAQVRSAGKSAGSATKKFFLGDPKTSLLYKEGRGNLKAEISAIANKLGYTASKVAANDAIKDSEKISKTFTKKAADAKYQADLNREEAGYYESRGKDFDKKIDASVKKRSEQFKEYAKLARKESKIYDADGDKLLKKGGFLNKLMGKDKKSTAEALRIAAAEDEKTAKQIVAKKKAATLTKIRAADAKATAAQLRSEAKEYDVKAKQYSDIAAAHAAEAQAFRTWIEQKKTSMGQSTDYEIQLVLPDTILDDDTLAQYGKKGMRWGVRKDKPSASSSKSKTSSMSDQELKATVARMNLERSYSKLVAEKAETPPSAVQRGAEEVKNIMANAGRNAIQNYTQQIFSAAIKTGVAVAVKKSGLTLPKLEDIED